jgi:hypothetical protein
MQSAQVLAAKRETTARVEVRRPLVTGISEHERLDMTAPAPALARTPVSLRGLRRATPARAELGACNPGLDGIGERQNARGY